jgi:hypothetical protein
MDVTLYTSGHGTLVLVPACMLPTRDAERLHGPLQLCTRAQVSPHVDERLRARIEEELDRKAYALVTVHEAKTLLGLRHARACSRQLGLWPRMHRRRNGNAGMRV